LATDARCATWANSRSTAVGSGHTLLEKLEAQGFQQEPWASRWPECAAIPDDYDVIFEAGALWRYPDLDVSPFVDEAAGDLHIDLAGPAFNVPGFEDIPIALMGVQD